MNALTAMSHLEKLRDKVKALKLVEALMDVSMSPNQATSATLERNEENMHSLKIIKSITWEFLSEQMYLEKKLEKIELDENSK